MPVHVQVSREKKIKKFIYRETIQIQFNLKRPTIYLAYMVFRRAVYARKHCNGHQHYAGNPKTTYKLQSNIQIK